MSAGGSFTIDGGAWLNNAPHRSDLTFSQLADLLRLAIDGEPLPERYQYAGPQDILADLHLVAGNAIRNAQGRAELAEETGAEARAATGRLWRLVFDNHKRKTLQTADVRAALEQARP